MYSCGAPLKDLSEGMSSLGDIRPTLWVAIHVAAQDIYCCRELTSQGGNSATAILVAHDIDPQVHSRHRQAARGVSPT